MRREHRRSPATAAGSASYRFRARARPGRPGPVPLASPARRSRRWRNWRTATLAGAFVLLGAAIVTLLAPTAVPLGGYDPADTSPFGTHALADILAARGTAVIRTTTPAAAQEAADSAGTTLVISTPALLTTGQLDRLATLPADLVIVAPTRAALAALAPAVRLAPSSAVRAVPPDCGLPAAQLAGPADLGGERLRVTTAGATACYPVGGRPTLVQYQAGGRLITVLGTGAFLTNASLGQQGNAALALDLLGRGSRVVWLVPIPGRTGLPGQPRSLLSLIPRPAYLVVLQLGLAVLLAAAWRARRLGPLVPEPLPVVVRAAETVEGHARLYQARQARGQAALALRAAAVRRIMPLLGVPAGADQAAIVAALTRRLSRSQAEIEALLYGPVPASNSALTALAGQLDALEREVRAQ